jgi:chromosome partitioning protein
MIPRDVVIPESSSFGVPVLEYDPLSRGARGYVELAKEVL